MVQCSVFSLECSVMYCVVKILYFDGFLKLQLRIEFFSENLFKKYNIYNCKLVNFMKTKHLQIYPFPNCFILILKILL